MAISINTDKINSLASKKNYSIRQLEIKCELGNGTIGKWKANPNATIESLCKVAKELEVDINELLEWK